MGGEMGAVGDGWEQDELLREALLPFFALKQCQVYQASF